MGPGRVSGDAGARGLVGRRAELVALDEAVGRADAGEPQFVVIGGEAGVGKTHLIDHVADRLEAAGARVLRTDCVELGVHGLPLAPVTSALRQMAALVGVDTLRRTMPGAEALPGLLPEYGARTLEPDRLARMSDLFAALLQWFGGERLAVLVVDDLQRADRSSRDLLGFLAHTLRSCQVLVLAAYRSDELAQDHPLRPFLAELGRVQRVRRLELGRFNRAETAELIASHGLRPSARLVEGSYRRSGGNAFFALELAALADPAGLPESLRDLLLRRLTGLAEQTRQVVRVAAVSGQPVRHRLLAAVAGLSEPELLAGVRGAVDAQVLVPDGDGYAYRHPLVREAVLDGLLPVERARLHRAVAEALEADPGLVAADRCGTEIAFHWQEAGEAAKALPALLGAAEEAGRLPAQAEQAHLLTQALSLWPQVPDGRRPSGYRLAELFDAAITAASWAGDHALAMDLLDQAIEAVDPVADPERAAMLLAHRGMVLYNLGRPGVLAAVEESLAALPAAPTAGRARVLDLLAVALVLSGRCDQARRLAEEAAAIATALGIPELRLNAQTTLGWAQAEAGAFGDALAVLGRAAELAVASGAATQLARIQLNTARAWQGLGDPAAAARAARAAIGAAEQAGLARGLGTAGSLQLAQVLTASGRWEEADLAAAGALELGPSDTMAAALHAARAEIALRRGDQVLATEQLSLAVTLSGDSGAGPSTLPVRKAQAEAALAGNRVEDARAALDRALPMLGRSGDPLAAWELLATAARVERLARARAAALSQPYDEARTSRLRRVAARVPADAPATSAYARWFAAELGDDRSWERLAAAWDAVGQPFQAASARLGAAEAAVAGGDHAGARDLLEAAGTAADRLSARPLLEEVRWLARQANLRLALGAGGEGDGKADDLQRLGLTDREVEVLRHVTDGRSNRQIAERLFISTKTVSVHVSNILAKLGVASRGEAAATAHRLRVFDADPPDPA
jgi:DNA-binding CsgD family transcriptional regulator/tetratricopeptide (TPR) repeat protein